MTWVTIKRALVSVSDKTGLVDFAKGLEELGVELLSTGGTFGLLKEAGLSVTEVSEFTGFPELFEGRIKSLHPRIHGGILFRRDQREDVRAASQHGIEPIDMVVVNLYPFEATVARPPVVLAEAIEQIDIGGPAMLRSAAKNHAHVAVVIDPGQYGQILEELQSNAGRVSLALRQRLALAAFERTAQYDRAISDHLAGVWGRGASAEEGETGAAFPKDLVLRYRRGSLLRYGENPHQPAAVYIDPDCPFPSVVSACQRHGKELSYNNLLDLDAALGIVREFQRPAAVVIKHNNPCGAAVADHLDAAFCNAYAGDPTSAFGSIIGFNRSVDRATAHELTEPGRFVEAVIAPSFEPEAFEILTTRPSWKGSVRLLETGPLAVHAELRQNAPQNRPIEGGLLRQAPDSGPNGFGERRVATERAPTPEELRDLEFAWAMVKHVRSNAIVLVKGEALVGVGAGQMSRVDATEIAIRKAGDRAAGSVLGSDAFFPFRDNVDVAAQGGIRAIVQPGGSKRDQESIAACNEHGLAMLFTGKRHFKH